MNKFKVLVVDDEVEIADAIDIYLTSEGYGIYKAYDGIQALKMLDDYEDIDLVILDVMMPKLDGIRTLAKIRENKEIPVIMLSAKSEDTDKILGLNLGADDYLTKPFNPLELIARVKSQLRRYSTYSKRVNGNDTDNIFKVGGLELNTARKELKLDGEVVKITPLEYKILLLLMENKGRVFSIEEIYEKVWNEIAINADTVTVHVRRIREKIEINPREPRYLKVVWGIGYKIQG
ncbi:response regulator transcription factor [uncultured Clostridium sp.]|jgi:DNA-binding response OmpR family regulator|uniref:response regulator transcription factor n=1 Tax=uncultured Clostridium sp. TaxID=59620 RepID=UPI00261A1D50|nr:response regulator transcription factor [uncultured Clostridium sp.]